MKFIKYIVIVLFGIGCAQSDQNNSIEEAVQTAKQEKEHSTDEIQNLPQELIQGKRLHEVNCSSCHHPDLALAGPPLKGVRDRWTQDTGNDTLIYLWVQDWELLASQNTYADSIAKSNPNQQIPFPELSRKDIDAILDYLDY